MYLAHVLGLGVGVNRVHDFERNFVVVVKLVIGKPHLAVGAAESGLEKKEKRRKEKKKTKWKKHHPKKIMVRVEH